MWCLQDIIFSFPVKCKGGKWEIVQGLKIDDFSKAKLKATGAAPPICCIPDLRLVFNSVFGIRSRSALLWAFLASLVMGVLPYL